MSAVPSKESTRSANGAENLAPESESALNAITGVIKYYEWGSYTELANLLGRPHVKSGDPEAELWLGAHPHGSAQLACGTELSSAINRDPESFLGEYARNKFGDQLPFLLKYLAVERPLSIQAHPDRTQASNGFTFENEQNVPLTSPYRNYKDRNHKPELVIALTEFHALAGFRETTETLRLIEMLGYADSSFLSKTLREQGINSLFEAGMNLDAEAISELTQDIVQRCHDYLRNSKAGNEFTREVRTVAELGESNPNDFGILAALLMNRVVLEPGQGLYIAPSTLHAYLKGTAVEVMANSDNVLRGGLTSKHVDAHELLKITCFDSETPSIVWAEPITNSSCMHGFSAYVTPERDFQLRRADFSRDRARGGEAISFSEGPQILLCTKGEVAIESSKSRTSLNLAQGGSAWAPPGDVLTITSRSEQSTVFVTTLP